MIVVKFNSIVLYLMQNDRNALKCIKIVNQRLKMWMEKRQIKSQKAFRYSIRLTGFFVFV